ncbi:MAG: hypothetical protein Q8R92_18595, partial [Deltaproteobacteria bacterium]|nr:hypothetical protein [Deltaproteobacteria bacterium]
MISTLVGVLTLPATPPHTRDLTIEDRLRAQEAIERVYYSHQVGATRPFEEIVPQEILERKVRTYLKQTVALEKLWKTPITAEALQRELERIAANTRFPERLEEIYGALGDDPIVIQECFVRPVLVDRVTRSFFASDQEIHAEARLEAETLLHGLLTGTVRVADEHPDRQILNLVRRDNPGVLEEHAPSSATARGGSDPQRRPVVLEPEEFERWRARAAGKVGEIGPVREQPGAYVVSVALEETTDGARLAVYTVPKTEYEAWWEGVADRFDESSVKASAVLLSLLPEPAAGNGWKSDGGPGHMATADRVGSVSATCVPDDTWDNGILDDLPLPRSYHTAVWTGSLMIVWGGLTEDGQNTGARYDPLTDTWAATMRINAPAAHFMHTAVWTGEVMVIWGGLGSGTPATGGLYDPLADSWAPTSTLGAPPGRDSYSAVWTGNEMIVWSGTPDNAGGRYNPASNSWTATSTTGAPSGRNYHAAVWTGSQMIVWGGWDSFAALNTGGRYDPVTNIWAPMSTTSAPEARFWHSAIWTGSRMIV